MTSKPQLEIDKDAEIDVRIRRIKDALEYAQQNLLELEGWHNARK